MVSEHHVCQQGGCMHTWWGGGGGGGRAASEHTNGMFGLCVAFLSISEVPGVGWGVPCVWTGGSTECVGGGGRVLTSLVCPVNWCHDRPS